MDSKHGMKMTRMGDDQGEKEKRRMKAEGV
jgi:hypothetical protein